MRIIRGENEVVLVNNRSNDNTAALAKRYDIKVIDAFDIQH